MNAVRRELPVWNDWPELQPLESSNVELAKHVHPDGWVNPVPEGRYNLIVIGAGTAGLVTAIGAARFGAKVAMIERRLMGGDCLNVGCVPSKAILAAARVAATVRDATRFGIHTEPPRIDFAEVMNRMRSLRRDISPHDSADRFRKAGVDVYLGSAQFIRDGTVRVTDDSGTTADLDYRRAVIATGARAVLPPIDGIEDVEVLTNETLFSLTELPNRLIVIGGGPIGAEMAQAFARFGSQVTLVEKGEHILSREDSDAARIVQDSLVRDGVNVQTGTTVERLETSGNDKVVVIRSGAKESRLACDQILVAIGRQPNIDSLNLDSVHVRHDAKDGVAVNDRLQTTNDDIYAVGDVASKYKFTHAADFGARIVIANTLFKGRGKTSSLTIPWATYTSPELAHVGMTARDAESAGIEIDTYTQPLTGVDRAILEGHTEGFARVHVRRGTDQIVGGTVVAEHAGDLIAELTAAMTHGYGLKKIASTIHPYPTMSDAVRKLGDQYNSTRVTPLVSKLAGKWLRWTR